MKTIYIYSIIAVLVLTAACESNVTDVNLPEYNPKLVISSFLCPSDTASYVFINSTMKLYGDLSRMESLGTVGSLPEVIISDGTKEVVLDTTPRYGWKLDPRKMKIENGKNYHIRVSTDKGYLAEASCTVPERRDFSIEVDTISTVFLDSFRLLQVRPSFNDIPGEENFYRIKVELKSHCLSQKWELQELPVEDHFISDLNQDGNRLRRSIMRGIHYGFKNCDSVYVIVKLFHTEKSYYLYHKSLENYNDGDNPFTEPTPVFSNVKGGLGIFTSYTVDSAVIRLK